MFVFVELYLFLVWQKFAEKQIVFSLLFIVSSSFIGIKYMYLDRTYQLPCMHWLDASIFEIIYSSLIRVYYLELNVHLHMKLICLFEIISHFLVARVAISIQDYRTRHGAERLLTIITH